MPTIIVCSNFSKTSRNALTYACSLISSKEKRDEIDILVLNVFTIPAIYCGDGIALATIDNGLSYVQEDLEKELEWVREEYPQVHVSGKVTIGRLHECLKEEIIDRQASLVMIGTGGNYGDLWSWDANILSMLRDLPAPVLTIPPGLSFKPLQNIAFACNLKKISDCTPFNILKNIIHFTGGTLHVMYVTSQKILPGSIESQNELLVQNKLKELSPMYYTLYESEVVGAIGRFVEEKNIQLLLVIPRKHGVWESLFHKSHTKELAKLNGLPIMALH